MAVEKKKRFLYLLTFLLSMIAVGLVAAALGTDYWIVARPVRVVGENIIGGAKNVTGGELKTKFQGYINFGLFRGYKELDHGLGVRKGEIKIYCVEQRNLCGWVGEQFGALHSGKAEIQRIIDDFEKSSASTNTPVQPESGLFTFGLWVAVLVLAGLTIIWGLIAMGFAVFNASTRPIETITGPVGLYLWNTFGMFCSLLTFIMFMVLYFVDLKKNVLSPEDMDFDWTSEDRAELHFSFYLVVVSTALFLINICILALSGVDCKPRYRANVNEKALDGVMMY